MSSAPRRVRPASAADLPAILTLLDGEGLSPRRLGQSRLWVAADDASGPAGVVGLVLHGTEALLRSLAVQAAARGAGLGRLLVTHAASEARQRGAARLWAVTVAAAPFFERVGFTPATQAALPRPLATAPEIAEVCPSDAAVLRLDL